MDEAFTKHMTEMEKDLGTTLKRDGKMTLGNGEPKPPATSRQRIGNTIEELTALVADLKTLIATLATIRDRL